LFLFRLWVFALMTTFFISSTYSLKCCFVGHTISLSEQNICTPLTHSLSPLLSPPPLLQVVWRLRELLEKQQTILKSCQIPGFEEVTVDPNVVEIQRQICCVLHACLDSWKKVGSTVYLKSLKKDLEMMRTKVLEDKGQLLLEQATVQKNYLPPPPGGASYLFYAGSEASKE
jgi:hypothetical protein